MNFTTSRYAILFLNSENYIMHVISHEWNRSMFVTSTMCFVWDTKPDLPKPLPWLVAKSHLWILLITTTIIIITTTTARVGCPSRAIQAPWIVGHLQLKIPSQPYQLLMLLDGGLQFKERRVSDKNKWETTRRKKSKGKAELTTRVFRGKG